MTTAVTPQDLDCDEAASTLTENCDYPLPKKQPAHNATVAASDKRPHGDDDEVAMPIPIATLVFQDGRTQPVYKPLAGHEHLFRTQSYARPLAPLVKPVSKPESSAQVAPTLPLGSSQPTNPGSKQNTKFRQQPSCKQQRSTTQGQSLLKSKGLKRSRSVAQGPSADRKTALDEDDVEEGKEVDDAITNESHTFYIGDIPALKKFLHCRFDELTMKPLRGIVTHWVKLLEPRRLGDWGKYHEKLPSEAETPPWWPKTVIYKEPSHLKKNELSTLAVEIMLVHRKVDEMKRKGSWITQLRDFAKFTIQTTSADHFSSSKGTAHSEEMKERAQERILPSIFDVAQLYEDHIMQYSLYEGSGNVDLGKGIYHTWRPIPRPARRLQYRKRPRRLTRRGSDVGQEALYEASGEETEADENMTTLVEGSRESSQSLSSPRPTTAASQIEAQTPRPIIMSDESLPMLYNGDESVSASTPCTPASSHGDTKMYRATSTPNSSFDQSLHGLHLEEDLDMKPLTRTLSLQGDMKPSMCTTPVRSTVQPSYHGGPYNQPMQCSSASTGYNSQVYRHHEEYPASAPSPFGHAAPTFVNPFSMFNTSSHVMSYGQYAGTMRTTQAFPYEQGVFPSTPMGFANMPMTPADTNMTFNGLPSDYAVDPERLRHF
ncbi:hypothetical protein G6514_001646 [Epicoccum nigrum]|nr:hypothetical protein G6514_001646 [Epicoccum nigrum]